MFGRQKRAVVSALNLPEDVFFGEMLLSFVGSREVTVENYKSIVLFSDGVLKLQGKTGRLIITGRRLSIEYYDKEQLKLKGSIQSAQFESL